MAKLAASPGSALQRSASLKISKPSAKAPPASQHWSFAATNFIQAYEADAMEQVRIVKRGVPATAIDALAKRMAVPKEKLVGTLGLARATIDRKVRENKPLSSNESSRVLGMARLVGQVQAMVQESGNPQGFNAPEWVGRWLQQPLAALGGQRPEELMDTPEGQGIVSQVVARMQSGAYS